MCARSLVQDGDRMVRDHGLHPRHFADGLLAAHQPQCPREDSDAADDDGHIQLALRIHVHMKNSITTAIAARISSAM
jgi:hypothetical protein